LDGVFLNECEHLAIKACFVTAEQGKTGRFDVAVEAEVVREERVGRLG